MKPGVSHRETTGSRCASQSCRNAWPCPRRRRRWRRRGARGCWRARRPARPSSRASAVTTPAPNPPRSSSTVSGVDEGVQDRAHVVGTQPVLRDEVRAGSAGRRARPVGDAAVRGRQVAAGRGDGGRVVRRRAGRRRRSAPARPSARRRRGRPRPSPPPSIIAGPPMPRLLPSVAMIVSQLPGQRGVAGEAVPGDDGQRRDHAAQLCEQPERGDVELGDRGGVGVAGPPAAALGEDHDRAAGPCAASREQPVVLVVVVHALRAREHRVVVGHARRRAGRRPSRCR